MGHVGKHEGPTEATRWERGTAMSQGGGLIRIPECRWELQPLTLGVAMLPLRGRPYDNSKA